MKTQNTIVLDHLEHRPLTAKQASSRYGIERLAARICELRGQGYDVRTQLVKVRTRRGETRVARYSLA